jgi:hypothetical protein
LLSDVRKALFGLGVVGERPYLIESFNMAGGYPHGIVVEIIGHFGFIIGLFLNWLLIIKLPFNTFQRIKTDKDKITIFIFSIALASQLFSQDSYIQNRYFFLYLAVIMSAVLGEKGRLVFKKEKNSLSLTN